MKTKFFVLAAAVAAICGTTPALAQYPGVGPGFDAYSPAASAMFVPPAQYPVAPSVAQIPYHMMGVAAASYGAPMAAPVSLGAEQKGKSKCDGGCSGKCDGCCSCCLTGGWCHQMSFYGDYLYLRARDAELAYAVPFDGPVVPGPPNTVQVGPVGVLDMDFQPAYRAGFDYVLDKRTKVGAAFTMLESATTDSVVTQAGNVVRSIVSHPNTDTAGQSFLESQGRYEINFDILDVHYLQLISYCDDYQLALLVGTRVLQHEQELQVDFLVNGTETVITDIDFYGAGTRIGLEYERYVGCQWTMFAKGYASLIPGEFRADFDQGQSYDVRVIDTAWKAGRLVTIWDLELGLGWSSKCGWYSASAGYVYSAWTNMVQTDEWIRGVHTNSFLDMDSTSTFDGLIARFEARY